MERKIIVHFHFFKNAGTTVNLILRNNFPNHYFSFDLPTPSSVISGEEAITYIRKNTQLRVLTSHQLLYPLPDRGGLTIYSLFFLRHPIDRIGSVYRYNKFIAPSPDAIAKGLTFKDYVLWLLDGRGKNGVSMNFQVRRLSFRGNIGEFRGRILSDEDLGIARKRLETSGFFGIVERFDESLISMKEYLQKDFPGLNYSYTIQNRSSEVASFGERLNSLREELGSALHDEVVSRNSLDLQLYDYGLKLFDDRMHRMKNSY
jgi:hypothetical protein